MFYFEILEVFLVNYHFLFDIEWCETPCKVVPSLSESATKPQLRITGAEHPHS